MPQGTTLRASAERDSDGRRRRVPTTIVTMPATPTATSAGQVNGRRPAVHQP